MSVNIASLASATTTATALSNLILVNPNTDVGIQPQQKTFPDGSVSDKDPSFIFNYEGENTVLLESDITDHFIENNTAINDQIALKPEIITTHGFIGELNDVVPDFLKALSPIADKLTVISAYKPALSITALLAYNQAVQAYQIANNAASAAVSVWKAVTGGEVQNKQQVAFQQFYGYYKNRTLFTVQTPWAIFKNCAIKSLRAVQDADTRVITDFEIQFKVLRFAQTVTTGGIKLGQGRWNNQSSSLIDNGVSTPKAGFSLGTNISNITGAA